MNTRKGDFRKSEDEPSEISSDNLRPCGRISVLHLIYTMAYGGIETVIINWLKKLDRSRFDVHLACFSNPDGSEQSFFNAAKRNGLLVDTIPWSRRKPVIKASRALAALLRKHKVDILHTHNCYADLVGVITARFVPVKTITTSYVWDDLGWKLNLIQFIELHTIKHCNRVTAHCEETRQGSISRGFAPDDVRTLICGFESHRMDLTPERRRSLRLEWGAGDEHKVLVNVSRMYPEKDQAFLLRAFARIHRTHPSARLWICGVGPLEASLKALCSELRLNEYVSFLGFVKDLSTVLALADIQVHPSQIEGVPLSLCAGMAANVPIIASKVGGIPEVIKHEKTGLLVEKDDEIGFVKAVVEVLDNPDLARALGDNARIFIENDYSLERAVRALEETYFEMLPSA